MNGKEIGRNKFNIRRLLHRGIPLVVACVILLSCVVGEPVKASAASVEILNWRTMATGTESAGYTTYKVSIPEKYMTVKREISGYSSSIEQSLLGSYVAPLRDGGADYGWGRMYITFHMPSAKEQTPNYYFDVNTAPDGAQYGADFTIVHSAQYTYAYEYDLSMYFAFSFYDKNYRYIDSYRSQTAKYRDFLGVETETTYSMRGDRWEDAVPDNARYFIACFVVCAWNIEQLDDSTSYDDFVFNYQLKDYSFFFTYNVANFQEEQIGGVVDGMGDSGDKLGDLGDDMQTSKPSTEDVDLNGITPNDGLNDITVSLKPVITNDLVVKLMIMVATLMLVSYVLFGKKGG